MWSFFLWVLALSSVICQPIHLSNASCGLRVLVKKVKLKHLFSEKFGRTVVYFCYVHAERIFQ